MRKLPALMSGRGRFPAESWFGDRDQLLDMMWKGWSGFQGEDVGGFPLDLEETEKEYVVSCDLPGVSKDDVHLSLENNILTIEVKQSGEEEKKEKNFVVKERFRTFASRSLSLPLAGDGKVHAALDGGVLSISIEKTPDKQVKKIAIS